MGSFFCVFDDSHLYMGWSTPCTPYSSNLFCCSSKNFKCKLEVLSDRDYLAIISVQKSDQDIIQFQVWMIIFGLNVLLAPQLYKLAILAPPILKWHFLPPIFSPFCKSDAPVDFYKVNANVGLQNRQFV